VVTKSRSLYSSIVLALGAAGLLVLAGCGGGSTTNVVSVTVSPSVSSVIVSQSLTLTSIVSGTTNLNVTWACTYTTTTVDSSGKTTTGTATACNASTGNIPASSANTTVTFTAPNSVPDLTKLAGSNCTTSAQNCQLAITITATSAADTKKTGTATITLDSGIAVVLNPPTASVPTGEQQPFSVQLTNDLQSKGVSFLITQGTPTATVPYPALATCSPGCGSLTSTTGSTAATYTAPATVPTTATLTIVATSNADTTRFTVGSITIIQGGPITFNSISPTIVPQGGTSYEIYLDAPFISSASVVTITKKSDNSVTTLNSSSDQLKVLFPIATSTVTNPPSTGARIRLTAQNLAAADTYTVSVSDPAQPVTKGAGPFSFDAVPVRPTSVASLPDSVLQDASSSNDLNLAIDGGYFGANGALAVTTFNGNSLSGDPAISSSRQLNLLLPTSSVNGTLPGLYPLSVGRTTAPLPSSNNPSVTNMAVFPDYSTIPPSVLPTSFAAGSNPGAVDVDTRLGILAVAETGSNLVQFFNIGNGTLTPASSVPVNKPSGLSINQANHTVAVVSFQDQSVQVFPLPGSAGAQGVSYPVTISLAGLIPSNVSPAPLAYSIGVDSDTNNALVAFSSSANPTTAKVGFLLDLNADSQTCLPSLPSSTKPPCIHAQVTLNTGQYPQIAMVPHSHLAMVTPGGTGVINGVDVTKASSSVAIASVSVTSGLVTVSVTVPSGQTLGLNPGNPGTVLIQNVPPGTTNNTNFNGVFTIQSVINTNNFTYALNSSVNDTATGDASSFAFFSTPNITVGVSQTAQGIAISPITRTAAIADANATGVNAPQINLLNSIDLTPSSISFRAGCTAFTTLNCAGAPELLGTSSVAFQPYANLLVSYNPQQNQVSISNPVTQQRYAFACTAAVGSCITNPDPAVSGQVQSFLSQITLPGSGAATVPVTVNGGQVNLNLFGGLAVDPATNQAFVVQSGSGTVQIVNLGPANSTTLKSAQITELQVPTVSGALIGGIAGALMPQGTLACVNKVTPSLCDLAGVQVFGSGFDAGTQVRLDGVIVATLSGAPSSRQFTFTIPHDFLALPHRYAVDVVNSHGVRSNSTDFFVITSVDMKTACTGGNPLPSSVAIADQLPGQGFAPIAVVSNSGCNNVSVIDIAAQLPTYTNGVLTGFAANPNFATIRKSIATGTNPLGVAASPRFGIAVAANNVDGTASVLDLVSGTQKVAAVTIGSNPTGVAIDEGTGTALITNTGSNTVSLLNLALLFGSSPATTLSPLTIAVDTSPIAVAIDPDRGTNNRGLAVVSALQLVGGSSPVGVLDSIDIGGASPAKSATAAVGTVTATPTGVVFNPSVSPTVFYANSSGGNVVTTFNPTTGGTSSVRVGINPTSLALNPQTGGIMTVNSTSQTLSILDTISNPFKTRSTFGLGGSPQFGIAIDQFTNLAVIADQAHNRVLIFPVPN
jgi:DNA-binding beta-propeller fold protein YncE